MNTFSFMKSAQATSGPETELEFPSPPPPVIRACVSPTFGPRRHFTTGVARGIRNPSGCSTAALDARTYTCLPVGQPKMSPDVAKCLLGWGWGKVTPAGNCQGSCLCWGAGKALDYQTAYAPGCLKDSCFTRDTHCLWPLETKAHSLHTHTQTEEIPPPQAIPHHPLPRVLLLGIQMPHNGCDRSNKSCGTGSLAPECTSTSWVLAPAASGLHGPCVTAAERPGHAVVAPAANVSDHNLLSLGSFKPTAPTPHTHQTLDTHPTPYPSALPGPGWQNQTDFSHSPGM